MLNRMLGIESQIVVIMYDKWPTGSYNPPGDDSRYFINKKLSIGTEEHQLHFYLQRPVLNSMTSKT